MATTKRIKNTAQIWTAQSRDDVAAAISEIGKKGREIDVLTASMNDEIALVVERFQPLIDALKKELQSLQSGVQSWCESHRAELTQSGKTKTVNMITGTVNWRIRPPSVSVRGTDTIIELLKSKGLGQYIRTKEEINKDAVLTDPSGVRTIPGITVVSGVEDFVIEPFEQEVQ